MQPADADAYFGKVLRDAKPSTRTGRAAALTVFFQFLELRHKVELHNRHFCASQLYLGGMSLFAVQELLGHAWTRTTARYIHVHGSQPRRRRLGRRPATGERPMERTGLMKWNLRLAAANRGIWKASEFQRLLAQRGLVISAGKMSGLWSGNPNVIKLDELDIICAVLGCGVEELLLPEPETVPEPKPATSEHTAAAGEARPVTPRPRTGRSLPPR